MNLLLCAFLFCSAVILSLAHFNNKGSKQDETNNLLIKRAESLQKTDNSFEETKIKAKTYIAETDKKWSNSKEDKDGLLKILLQNKNETSTSSTSTTVELDNKVPSKLDENGNFIYDIETSEPEQKTKVNPDDYFSSQVAIFSWPVKENAIPMCAGSLISKCYVLTTANCVDGEERVLLVSGARNIQDPEPFQVKIESSHFIIHEKWDLMTLKHNIALIKLPECIEFNEYISPVNLPTKADENKTFIDYNASLVAWSSDREQGVVMPMVTTDIIISNVKCFFIYQSFIMSSHICLAGSRNNSSCAGECGDQLIVKDDDGNAKLIGLLSFGMQDGCELKQPVVFTRVASYLTWIESHVEEINSL